MSERTRPQATGAGDEPPEDATPRGGLEAMRLSVKKMTRAVAPTVRRLLSENSTEYVNESTQDGGQ